VFDLRKILTYLHIKEASSMKKSCSAHMQKLESTWKQLGLKFSSDDATIVAQYIQLGKKDDDCWNTILSEKEYNEAFFDAMHSVFQAESDEQVKTIFSKLVLAVKIVAYKEAYPELQEWTDKQILNHMQQVAQVEQLAQVLQQQVAQVQAQLKKIQQAAAQLENLLEGELLPPKVMQMAMKALNDAEQLAQADE
jgi:hypothetical protein